MAYSPWIRTAFLSLFVLAAPVARGASFSAADNAFTMDLPAGWKQTQTTTADTVLSLQKDGATLHINKVDCHTETCIEKKINQDLADVKSKKMKVLGDSYTGEEIKTFTFSTGEPFFYFSFFSSKNDFSAGYFLINAQAYSILAKDLSYAETDLIFSFISPVAPPAAPAASLEMDLKDPRAYEIAALPDVAEAELEAPSLSEKPADVQPVPEKRQASSFHLKPLLHKLKKVSFLSQNMPPYVRRLGHVFDGLVLLFALYAFLFFGSLLGRLFFRAKEKEIQANPNSLYPIRFKRLYGTPSLIFRAKDNQGNVLISLSARWDSLFIFAGILLIVFTFGILALCGFGENSGLLPLSAYTYNMIYSACSLAIPLGIVIFFCGVVWSQLVLREITLFDRKGKKAAIILQKGFGLKEERYEIYFARSKEVLSVSRKRFSFRRNWQIKSHEGNLLASLQESNTAKAFFRKLCGHLWGFLRADYFISGQMDSTGTIQNMHAAFDCFTCNLDKPQAINARDLLAVSLLINIRDRDKWYPWFN